MLGFLEKLFGETNEIKLKSAQSLVGKINELESEFVKLSDDELKAKTTYFKKIIFDRLENIENKSLVPDDAPKIPGIIRNLKDKLTFEVLDEILPEAFATVREVSKRILGMRHFDVQLLGGIMLHWGRIAEMKTGEGKTLVATLPVYLNALCERGVHVITVNDYLARRDAAWMGKIYNFLGMSVGLVVPHQKKA